MDKRVLLVLFSLQVFLLITAFTSTDAAALVSDDQRTQAPILEVSKPNRRKDGKKLKQQFSRCWLRPGACSLIGTAAKSSPDLEELPVIEKKKLQQVLHQN
ncbi:uncharacterized protein PEZ65_011757 [Lycodopsis pacificus]